MGRRWQVFLLRLVWINEVVFMVLELNVAMPAPIGWHLPVHKCLTSERLQGIGGSLS